MLGTPDALKFRIMMCLLASKPSSCTVTGISLTLNEKKYTITRSMNRMEQEGLIDRSDVRAPVLTDKGRMQAERYRERVSLAQNHLLYEGMDMEHAKQDACSWALYCSDELMDVIRASDEWYRIKYELRDRKAFSGATFCKKLKDGSYSFPFMLYREHMKDNNNISMANNGFEHPCTLYVEKGEGIIQLRALSIHRKAAHSDKMISCKINKLEYLDSGRFVSAEIHGDVISIPASALSFVNMGSGLNQILHGSVCLRMECTGGMKHIPEPKAMFTILI